MAPRCKTRQEIEEEIKDIDGDGGSSPEPVSAESVESRSSRGRGRVKLPDAWTRVLHISDKLKMPLKSYWVESDVIY